MDERQRARRGLAVRRAVLGNEHVDRALRGRTRFDREFQDLLTRYAWGEIWTRPGLPRRTRSLVTLAALVALGREHELRLHLRAALRNGVSRAAIKEVLLQMAVLLRRARRERRLSAGGGGVRRAGRGPGRAAASARAAREALSPQRLRKSEASPALRGGPSSFCSSASSARCACACSGSSSRTSS